MNQSRLPYPGLRAFDREEADLFFGRDGVVDNMIDRLAETRFLAVLGSSGSGKSSLVKTGLLDGLELGLHPAGSVWKICEFTPGGRLFGNLADALYDIQMDSVGPSPDAAGREQGVAVLEGFLRMGPRSLIQWTKDGYLPESGNLLLLVDQFEELFRYGGYSEREEAEAFVKLLIESTSDENSAVHCVITMRSDFLGACSLIPGLAEIINAGAFLTPRMSRNDCREAIVGPARIVGVDIEDGLVNHLLNELVRFAPWDGEDDADQVRQLARRADQLPVMQHLLNRLWQHARDRAGGATIRLTQDDYADMGGLNGALDAHGEELLASLSADDQVLAEQIFRALVNGESPETATRRPLRFEDIVRATNASDDQVRRILDVFRADDCNFLRPGVAVPLQESTVVDISHESLIRQWSKLSGWVTEEARSANLWRRVSTAADRYERQVGDLLTGLDLANLSSWWNEEQPQAHWTARYSDNFDGVAAFLEKSVAAQKQREREKAEHDLRERRRLRIGLASVSALAIVASILAFWAVGAEDRANDANVAAFSIVQNMTDDLFAAIDDGLTTPITERSALIDERSGEIVGIAERLDDSDQAALMHIRWLTLTAGTLLDAGWVREALDHTTQLEALLSDNEELMAFANDAEIRFDALLTLARAEYAQGHYDRAIQILDSISDDPADSDTVDLAALQRSSIVHFLESEIAIVESRFADVLRHVERLRSNYRSARDHAAELGELDVDEKEQTRTVINRFIRGQGKAITGAHNSLQSAARGLVDLGELVVELDEALNLYATLVPDEASTNRALRAFLGKAKADYYLDVVNNKDVSFRLADESLGFAAGLLREDPENLWYRSLLIDSLIQRSQALAQYDNLEAAREDLTLARQALFDTKLKRPPMPGWRRMDSSISFYEFHAAEETGKPETGKLSAARMKAEMDFTAERPGSAPGLLRDNAVFLIWALVNSDATTALPAEEKAAYYQYLLDRSTSAFADPDDDYARRRMRSWSYTRLLSLSPDAVGEEAWQSWYRQAADNASVADGDPKKSMFNLPEFRYTPWSLLGQLEPQHAQIAKSAIGALQALDPKQDIAQALPVFRAAFTGIPIPEAGSDALLAYVRLQNNVSASFFNFTPTADTAPEWIELIDSAIAVNETVDRGDVDSHIIHCWMTARRAGWARDSGDTDAAPSLYANALDVCMAPPDGIDLSRTSLRNSMLSATELFKAGQSGVRLSDDTMASVDRLITEIMPADDNARNLADSRNFLQSMQRAANGLDNSGGPFGATRLSEYKTAIEALLAATDPGGDEGANEANGGIPDGQATGQAGLEGVASELNAQGYAETDFKKLLDAARLRDGLHVNWTYTPLYAGTWRTVFGTERDELLGRARLSDDGAAQYVRVAALPFYADVKLVEIEQAFAGGRIGVHTVLVLPERTLILNGTLPPIVAANRQAPVRLETAEQVAAYVRFFLTYVGGQGGGARLVVDRGDEIDWWASAEAEERERIARIIRPLAVWPDDSASGHWKASATVQYSNSLFTAIVSIQPDGTIGFDTSRLIDDDLPIRPVVISERRSGAGSGDNSSSIERRIFEADDFGFVPAPNFGNEILALGAALEEQGPEPLQHMVAEYVHLVQDEVLLSTLGNPTAYLNVLAYTLLTNEIRLEDAMAMAKSAHERSPDRPHVLDTYGWALVKTGDIKQGIEILLEAEALFAENPASDQTMLELYVHLGHAYRLDGQNELARAALEKALAYDVPGKWLELAKSDLALLDE